MTNARNPLHPAVAESRAADRLAELREATAALTPPPDVEERLLRAFRERTPEKATPSRPRLWWMPPLALAATVAMVSWMVRGPAPMPVEEPGVLAEVQAEPGPFLALRSMDRIALEPAARVVRTEFPRAFLAQWGLPVPPERAGEPVRAELLYAADGEALAVRLLD